MSSPSDREAVLPGAALIATAVAVISAAVLPWKSRVSDEGLWLEIGAHGARWILIGLGALGLLVGLVARRRGRPDWFLGVAGLNVLAAVGCIGGLFYGDGDKILTGPAPGLALSAFALGAGAAFLAARAPELDELSGDTVQFGPRPPRWVPPALAIALAVQTASLVLPWSQDQGYQQDGFAHVWVLPFVGIAFPAAVAVGLVGYLRQRTFRLAVNTATVAAVSAVVSIVLAIAMMMRTDDRRGDWEPRIAAPITFAVAAVAAALLAHLLNRTRDGAPAEAPDRISARGAIAGLALFTVLAGTVGPWQRLTGNYVREVEEVDAYSWLGSETSGTDVLRWVLLGVVVALAVSALVRRLRAALPVVCLAGGAAIAVLALAARPDPADGIASSIGAGSGSWVVLAGGAALALTGAVAFVRTVGSRRVAVPVAAVALLASGLGAVSQPRAEAAVPAVPGPVLGGRGDATRLGGPALDADVESLDDESVNAATGADGTVYAVEDVDRYAELLVQIVDGRALPVTMIDAPQVELLAVTSDAAIVRVDGGSGTDQVYDLDLRRSEHDVDIYDNRDSEGRTALLRQAQADKTGAGEYPRGGQGLTVRPAADGSFVVGYSDESERSFSYRIPAAAAAKPWQLDGTTAITAGRIAAPKNLTYDDDSNGLWKVQDADGRRTPFAGFVTDERCTLSRDPLSSRLDLLVNVAVDSAGNVWFRQPASADVDAETAYVLTTDGVLRAVTSLGTVRQVWTDSHGALFVTGKADDRPVRVITDPAALARAAAPLGPVLAGCVSDNRVKVPGGHATAVAGPPRDAVSAIPLDAHGTWLALLDASGYPKAGDWLCTLVRVSHGKQTALQHKVGCRDPLAADGTGGAWWDDAAGLFHAGTSGPPTRVATPKQDYSELAADTGDGSVYAAVKGGWLRIDRSGGTTQVQDSLEDGRALVVRNGRGYVAGDPGVLAFPESAYPGGRRVLGRSGASLAGAVSRKLDSVDAYADAFGVGPGGELVGYDATHAQVATTSGRAITPVAGPDAGVPYGADSIAVFGNTALVYDTARGTAVAVTLP